MPTVLGLDAGYGIEEYVTVFTDGDGVEEYAAFTAFGIGCMGSPCKSVRGSPQMGQNFDSAFTVPHRTHIGIFDSSSVSDRVSYMR